MGGILSHLPQFAEIKTTSKNALLVDIMSADGRRRYRILFDNTQIGEGVVVINYGLGEVGFFPSLGSAFHTTIHIFYDWTIPKLDTDSIKFYDLDEGVVKEFEERLRIEQEWQRDLTEEKEEQFNRFMENSNVRAMEETPVGFLPIEPRIFNDE
jgi:hypothetical protein